MAEKKEYQAGDKVFVFYPSRASAIGAVVDQVHPGGHLVDLTIEHPGHVLDGSKTTIVTEGIWKKQE